MNLRRTVVEAASYLVRKGSPRAYFRMRERELAARERERDTASFLAKSAQRRLMCRLCDPHRTSLDVGAHRGDYAIEMARHSRRVVAFEPIPELVDKLRDLARGAPCELVIEAVALSDTEGTAQLRVPRGKPGSSTLEAGNVHVAALAASAPVDEVTVRLRRLDDYAYDDVEFAKIDVEGHQIAMLTGGAQTLARCRPHLLVEIDETHAAGAIERIDEHLRAIGYQGFYLLSTVLLPMHSFDRERYHSTATWTTGRLRINDFFYFHVDRLAELERRCGDYTLHVS